MGILKKYIKNRQGVAAVEFALIAPSLLFMMIAMFDYGMYLNTTMKLENTSRAAAQYLILGGDEANLEADIMLPGSLEATVDNAEDFTIEIVYTYECQDAIEVAEGTDCGVDDYLREYIEVTVLTVYDTIVPFPGIPDTIDLQGRVRLQNN